MSSKGFSPSPTATSRPPKYCRKRSKGRTDRAYVRIGGKMIMLGNYGSPESKVRYAELIGKADHPTPTSIADPTVTEVMASYLEFAREYYPPKNKRRTSEYHDLLPVMRHLKHHAGSMQAREFGPKKLKEVRQAFIDAGQSRGTVNRNVRRVRRMFRWAASEELIPGAIWQNLAAVEGLRKGRSAVHECAPVAPVDDAVVEATLPFLPEVVADMVRLQRITGMRPGEVCKLRPCDIDRRGEVWFFKPSSHKTEHLGRERVVCIGPRAQEILLRYLERESAAYCFRPCDSEDKRRAARHAARKTPISYGNRPGSKLVNDPQWAAGEEYCADSYRKAIHRACDKAFPASEETTGRALQTWRNAHRWFPNQLRHAAATHIRREFGLEEAQIILGHSQANVTQLYAERDIARGVQVAKMIG